MDWDPSKWAIMLLRSLGLASGLRKARVQEINAARQHMLQKEIAMTYSTDSATDLEEQDDGWSGEIWTKEQLIRYAADEERCVLLLRGYAVDVTGYMKEHVRLQCRYLLHPVFMELTISALIARWSGALAEIPCQPKVLSRERRTRRGRITQCGLGVPRRYQQTFLGRKKDHAQPPHREGPVEFEHRPQVFQPGVTLSLRTTEDRPGDSICHETSMERLSPAGANFRLLPHTGLPNRVSLLR